MVNSEQSSSATIPSPQPDNTLGLISMALGIVSLMGFGLLLGIPAIILAIIALKKKTGDRGLSITGLVTGSISTLASLIFIIGMISLIVWSNNQSHDIEHRHITPSPQQNEHLFRSSQT